VKEYYELFKENLSTILIGIYGLGYIYIKAFYSIFNIQIEEYIQLVDILFLTINNLARVFAFYAVVEIVTYALAYFGYNHFIYRKIKEKFKGFEKPGFRKRFYNFCFNRAFLTRQMVLFIPTIAMLGWFIMNFLEVKEPLYFMMYGLLFWYLKMFHITVINRKRWFYGRYLSLMQPAIIFHLIVGFFLMARADARELHVIEQGTSLEFVYNGQSYSTNDGQYNYIGETSSHLFIYDKKCNKTLIFFKENFTYFSLSDTESNVDKRLNDLMNVSSSNVK